MIKLILVFYTYVFLFYLFFFKKIFGGICKWKRKESESEWLVLKKIEKFQITKIDRIDFISHRVQC